MRCPGPTDVKSDTGRILAPMGRTSAQLAVVDSDDDAVVEASIGAPVPLPALVLAPPRRPGWPMLAALAITCGVAAVGLGAWALAAETGSDVTPASGPADERVLTVLTDSRAERYPLRASVGRITLVVAEDDRAVLALDGLGPAPDGRAYQAWLVSPGSATPIPDATFAGTERAVTIERLVTEGTRIAVTLEPAGGVERPSRPLRLSAVRT
jgi:hypothetical protein